MSGRLQVPVYIDAGYQDTVSGTGLESDMFLLALLVISCIIIAIILCIVLIKYRNDKERWIYDLDISRMKNQFEQIISVSPIMFMLIIDGVIAEINENAKMETGLKEGEKAEKLYADADEYEASMEMLREKGSVKNHIMRLRLVEGEVQRCLMNITMAEYNGREAIVVWALEVEQSEKQRDELAQARRMLSQTAEKEREANLLKSRFLVNMSHEIRTPMNAIIGLTEIELYKNPKERYYDVFKKIRNSAEHLLEIINDILDMSKIEADKIELYEEEFELEELLNSAMLVAIPRLDGKQVNMLLRVSADIPRKVIGDKTRLWQILKNLLDNSAKFTIEGNIVLSATIGTEETENDRIVIDFEVIDTGVGIDDEHLQRIFMPYEQINNENQKKYAGTGLGMTISKQLCELMGGKLKIASRVGEGTTVQVTVPLRRVAKNERLIIPVEECYNRCILLIDADEQSGAVMEEMIKNCGSGTIRAECCEEAIEKIDNRHGAAGDIAAVMINQIGLEDEIVVISERIGEQIPGTPVLLITTSYRKRHLNESELEHFEDKMIEMPIIPTQFAKRLRKELGYKEKEKDESEIDAYTLYRDVRVLLCEDYAMNQEVATGMLGYFGVTAEIADNGMECLERLEKGSGYDLILMDLQMPVMDGYEAARRIREKPEYEKIPIISLTADAMKETAEKCLAMGMNDHMTKPIEFAELNEMLRRWVPEEKRILEGVKADENTGEAEAVMRFGGDRSRYEKALLEFGKQLPEHWPELKQSVNENESLRQLVHKICGAAGNLGEKEISEVAREFLRILREGSPNEERYQELKKECDRAKERIELGIQKETAIKKRNGHEIYPLLRELRVTLENYDPVLSAELIENLTGFELDGLERTKLELLCRLVSEYEFDAALEVLAQVLDKKS